MDKIDENLYRYILDNSSKITENWLALREKQSGSIYSIDSNEEIEKLLREQNTWTIKTVTSALLEDKTAFIEMMEQWATLVAKSRVESDTPFTKCWKRLIRYVKHIGHSSLIICSWIRR